MPQGKTGNLLRERPALLVSLPRNDVAFAEAALAGGADGLKVHLNVAHHASGTYFGSWAEERDNIRAILALGVPVGMVPGTKAQTITPAEGREIIAAGVDFFDAYLQDMPIWLPEAKPAASIMVAFGPGDAAHGWQMARLAGRCQLLELSIVPSEEYGTPLQESDLVSYAAICSRYPELPAIVPSQRALRPADVASILATGVRGILIGAIVTGKTAEEIRVATREFSAAVRRA
jgi:hypothetical protein